MIADRVVHEAEKNGTRSLDSISSPSASTATSTFAISAPSPSTSSSPHPVRSAPTTRLRYRQMVQPITPTEMEPVPEGISSFSGKAKEGQAGDNPLGPMRYPRVELSSLDLAKPRIYTRLLYFFEANDSQGSFPSSSASGAAAAASSASSSSSSSPPASQKKTNSKFRHHYHYHQSPFMDPMLLQASLALVLTDFFPLAGRLCSTGSKNQYIECNDHGVLFAVAGTTMNMQNIREGKYQDAVLPPRLFPVGLYPASLRDPPLLGIQLTYTLDNSLIMGVAMDSSVMDATSLVSFMDAWAKITQGKDFEPYPILDRSFLEKYGKDHGSNGVYRHQRLNNSPPPPILFDNDLDNDLDRGLVDADQHTEDEDEFANEQGEWGGKLDKADERRIQSLDGSSGEDGADIPTVAVEHTEQPGASIEDLTEFPRGQFREGSEKELEGGNLHLFHFTNEQLERIKKLASEQNIAAAACAADDKEISDKWVSTGDSLIAYLWKMSTITRRMEPDCKLMCGVVMDIRDRLTPVIPKGFIGNAILSIFVQMPVHSLLTTPLSLPSRLLRDELLLQTPEQICSAINWIQKQEYPHLIETDSNNPFGDDFMVWSFRKLDMYTPDFGHGRPRKVRIGRGGFGGGEGMCIIMDSEPPSQGGASGVGHSNNFERTRRARGVDVYLGLQGEHLQDFEKVHRGFMEGLLEPGSSNDWEIAPSISDARIRYTQENITLHVTPASSLIQNPGTLYISDECLYFFSSGSHAGFAIQYPSIIIHAIARESRVGPSIYCQLEGSLASLGPAASSSNGHSGGNGASAGQDEEEEEEEDSILELSFAPADVSSLDTIYENLSYCASLHQDDEAGDMDEDDYYEDDENDHDGLYADADIQGGYIPKSSSATVIGVVAPSSSSAAGASSSSASALATGAGEGQVEQIPDIDLQSGEWYTGNPETDARFELSEQGQVNIKQWHQNENKGEEVQTGKRGRNEQDGQGDEDVETGENSQDQGQEYTEEQLQEARSKMWRAY
ncbi:hypothetical protein BGZ79_007758 [Entomortierella chlamydospora]|nr:hypothetical protein BGZ79_007758 [Entomortierella chlamydospora]